jgi:hypothetical protein
MKRKLEINLIEINIIENLLWTLGYLLFAFFFYDKRPTVLGVITTFAIFVVIDNAWRFVKWVISKLR